MGSQEFAALSWLPYRVNKMNIDDKIRKCDSKFLVGDIVQYHFNENTSRSRFRKYDSQEFTINGVRGNTTHDYVYLLYNDDADDNDETVYSKKEELTMVTPRPSQDIVTKPENMGFEW